MMTRDDVLSSLGLQSRMGPADYLFPALGVFGAGMLVGACIALLTAPKSGQQLRGDIGETATRIRERVAPGKSNGFNVDTATREELYERAKDLDIEGRSEMNQTELAEAVRSSSYRSAS